MRDREESSDANVARERGRHVTSPLSPIVLLSRTRLCACLHAVLASPLTSPARALSRRGRAPQAVSPATLPQPAQRRFAITQRRLPVYMGTLIEAVSRRMLRSGAEERIWRHDALVTATARRRRTNQAATPTSFLSFRRARSLPSPRAARAAVRLPRAGTRHTFAAGRGVATQNGELRQRVLPKERPAQAARMRACGSQAVES